MSPRSAHVAIDADGSAKIDVVALAAEILVEGTRRETMVSQDAIRAMAESILDFNLALLHAANVIFWIEVFGDRPTQQVQNSMKVEFERLETALKKTGHITDAGHPLGAEEDAEALDAE